MSSLLSRQGVRELFVGLALLCATLALMLYPQEAMAAVREGLLLCYNVIIPSLFPFFVLAALVVDLGLASQLGRGLEGIMRPLFHVPGACCPALILGFVGGYPVGAKTALDLYKNGMCTKTEAERLLAFCNNSGPAFILGVVGAGVFSSSRVGMLLYLAHTLASLCVGLLFRFYRHGEEGQRGSRPTPRFKAQRFTVALTAAIKNSFLSTLNICAFVTFFTVVIRLLFLSGLLPALAALLGALFSPVGFSGLWAEKLLTGAIELSSGVWALTGAVTAGGLSMAAFMLGWAGLSVHCQVLSFLGGSGLSAKTYLVGKLLHGGISALFVALLVRIFPLKEAVSSYLVEQVEDMASTGFSAALTVSTAAAWGLFLLFFLAAVLAVRKTSRKKRRAMI